VLLLSLLVQHLGFPTPHSFFLPTVAVPRASSCLLLLPLRLQLLQRLLLRLTPCRSVELPDSPPLQLAMPVTAAVPPDLQYSPVHHLKLPGVHRRVARPGPLLLLLLGAVSGGNALLLLLLFVPGVPVLLSFAFCDDVYCSSTHEIVLPGLWGLDAQQCQTPAQLQGTHTEQHS
jgi:hypothetical protein